MAGWGNQAQKKVAQKVNTWAALDGLDPKFAAKIRQLIQMSGGRITIKSGYRSPERQAQLWAAAVKKYGKNGARKWVAPPGKSNHNKGFAVDLGGDLRLAHKLAGQLGLVFPMGHEPWHVEPAGLRSNAKAYTKTRQGNGAIDVFMQALSGQESGGNPTARNSRTGAYGEFQIMPANWSPWAKEAGLSPGAPRTPENQRKVARFKLNQYYKTFGSWDAVAVAWYAGPGAAKAWLANRNTSRFHRKQGKGNEPSIQEYVNSVIGRMGKLGAGHSEDDGHDHGSDEMEEAKPATTWEGQLSNFSAILSRTFGGDNG